MNHEAHLVAVGVQHEYWAAAGSLFRADVDVAETVVGYLGDIAAVLFHHVENSVFKAGGAEGVGEIGDQFQAFGVDVCVHKSSPVCCIVWRIRRYGRRESAVFRINIRSEGNICSLTRV